MLNPAFIFTVGEESAYKCLVPVSIWLNATLFNKWRNCKGEKCHKTGDINSYANVNVYIFSYANFNFIFFSFEECENVKIYKREDWAADDALKIN